MKAIDLAKGEFYRLVPTRRWTLDGKETAEILHGARVRCVQKFTRGGSFEVVSHHKKAWLEWCAGKNRADILVILVDGDGMNSVRSDDITDSGYVRTVRRAFREGLGENRKTDTKT